MVVGIPSAQLYLQFYIEVLLLSSLAIIHVGCICSVVRAMLTAISAPPLTPHPSWSGTLQRRSGAWPAARSMSAVGADVDGEPLALRADGVERAAPRVELAEGGDELGKP